MRHIPVAIELGIRVALDRDSTRVGKSAQSYFTSDILYKICDISSIRSDGIMYFGNSTVLQQLKSQPESARIEVVWRNHKFFLNCPRGEMS